MRLAALIIAVTFAAPPLIAAEPTSAPTSPAATRSADVIDMPFVRVDRAARQVRVACQILAVDTPLEFFCVTNGGPEHESVLRTQAKPSQIHAGLLMLGLEPGSPVKYIEAKNAWSAPFGPPVRVSVEWTDASGKTIRRPAEALLRSTNDAKKPVPSMNWIFAGSHQREDGAYLADLTGYVVTLCNFENALIDVPRLVSSANETLEWQYNADVGPKRGEAATMILEVIGDAATTRPATLPAAEVDDLTPQQAAEVREISALRDQWRQMIAPHEAAMRDAAKAHYAMVDALRKRQQALVDEADRLQALIEELDRAYADLSAPKP